MIQECIYVQSASQSSHVLIYLRNAQIATKHMLQTTQIVNIFERLRLKKEWSHYHFMSNTIIQEIRFLQHNCAKFTNTMISCLEYDLKKKIDIICMQESWIESNQITISHSTFNRILSEQKETHKQRIIIFVFKTFKFSITSRSNLCSNTNIQIFNISETNIENFTIINVYNEKCQKSSSNEYTIERKLKSIE
jgi:hypothetical protein